MALEKFRACMTGASAKTELEYQFNKDTDIEKNIWYSANVDFKATDWQKTTEVSTEDGTISGASRESLTVASFNQNIENTITEDSASAFLQRLHLEASAGDAHFRDLLSYGLNIRITTHFGDGSFVRETYMCTTITDIQEPFKQLMNSESEVTLNSRLNFEPDIENVGVGIEYPADVFPISVSTDVTGGGEDPVVVTVNTDRKTDISGLLDTNVDQSEQFKIVGYLVNEGYTGSTEGTAGGNEYDAETRELTATFTGVGTLYVVVFYAYAQDANKIYYTVANVQEVEINAPDGV